jgi:O-antigen ligase
VGAAAVVPVAMDPWGYNPFGPMKALVLAACAAAVAIGLCLDRELLATTLVARLRASWMARAAGIVWVVILLSTIFSINPRQSFVGSYPEYQGVLTWLAVTVIAFGAASLPWPESWQWVGRALSVSVTIMGGYALLQMLGADPVLVAAGANTDRVRSTLGNSSNAGVYLLFAASFLIERLRRDPSRAWRVAAGVAAALGLFMIVFTASRGAWVGLLVGAVVWLAVEAARWERSRRRIVIAAALAVMVALGVAVVAIPRLQKRVASASAGTIEWRLVVWQAAGRVALDRPLLGWGPNSFRYVYPSYRPLNVSANSNLGATAGDPHDIVVSAAASLGFPGALALLALMGAAGVAGAGIVRARRGDDLRPIALGTALAAGVTALLFHYATLDTMPVIAVLLGSLLAAQATPAVPGAAARLASARAVAIALAGAFSVVALAAAGLVAADVSMRGALAANAGGAAWPLVGARLTAAQSLAPWEPTFTWAIGKAAIQTVATNGDGQAYSDGQAALEAVRQALPMDNRVVYDGAYLTLRFGVARHDAAPIREAHAVFAALTDKDPHNPEYWSARGIAAAGIGDFTEALSDLQTAVSLAPGKRAYAKTLRQIQTMAAPAK